MKVTDDGTPTLTYEKTLTLTIIDINDPPVVDIAGNTIPENSQADLEIGKHLQFENGFLNTGCLSEKGCMIDKNHEDMFLRT